MKTKTIITGILFLFIFNLNLKAQWAKKDEVSMIVMVYKQGIALGFTEIQSIEFATCVIEKMKISMPNLMTSTKTAEEVRVIGRKIGLECASNYQAKITWNNESETLLRSYFNNSDGFKVLTQEAKNKFTDCVIAKLKIKYPKGFNKIPEIDAEKIGEECMLLIMK